MNILNLQKDYKDLLEQDVPEPQNQGWINADLTKQKMCVPHLSQEFCIS